MKCINESFKSIEYLIRSNEVRPNNYVFRNTHDSNANDESFTKTKSYEEAIELMRNGYTDPLEKIRRGVETAYKQINVQKTAVKTDIVGYAPCVPNAILGIPKTMINKENAAKKSKVFTIYYSVGGAWSVSADDFIKSGITVLSIINSFETNGYRVALKLVFFNASEGDEKAFAYINVKDYRQPIDLKKLTFPFCHPSMLRRIGFRWIETQPEIKNRWDCGYGWSDDSKYSYNEMVEVLLKNKFITEKDKFINIKLCRDYDFNPQAVAKACGLG